jgi:hypothetical protein
MISAAAGYVSSALSPFIPNLRLDTLNNIVRKCTLFAVPFIVVVGAANLPTVSAGPQAYRVCLDACLKATWGGFAPACVVACLPTLAIPGP